MREIAGAASSPLAAVIADERRHPTAKAEGAMISTTGTKRARSVFQNGVWGKWSRPTNVCQRAMVCWSAARIARKALRTRRRSWTLSQGSDQDDDGAEINLWAEESHRRRGEPLSATVTIAAEAESEALRREVVRVCHAAYGGVIGGMQATAAGACQFAEVFSAGRGRWQRRTDQNLVVRGKS